MVNKKIITAALTIMILGLLSGAGTYAYFTSATTSSNNIVAAGELDVDVTPYGEVPTPLFSTTYSDPNYNNTWATGVWYPGKVINDHRGLTIKMSNSSTLSARIYGVSAVMQNFVVPAGCPDSASAESSFKDNMIVKVRYNSVEVFSGTLSDLMTSTQHLNFPTPLVLTPRSMPVTLEFAAEMSTSAGNIIQGTNATVDLVIHATQDNDSAVNYNLGL